MIRKILYVFSWILFIVGIIAAGLAGLCTVGGAVTFVLTLINIGFAKVFSYFVIGYFGSLIALTITYLLSYAHCAIEKAVKA